MNFSRGYTLIELLVGLVIISILITLAQAAYARISDSVHLSSARSSLTDSLMLSISRSVTYLDPVVLCPSQDGARCLDTFDWSIGWLGFVDDDGNGVRSDNEKIITRQMAIADGLTLVTSEGRRRLRFQVGGSNFGSNVTFSFCSEQSGALIETLVLSNTGKLHRETPSNESSGAVCATNQVL